MKYSMVPPVLFWSGERVMRDRFLSGWMSKSQLTDIMMMMNLQTLVTKKHHDHMA